jgi:hypothetical protein
MYIEVARDQVMGSYPQFCQGGQTPIDGCALTGKTQAHHSEATSQNIYLPFILPSTTTKGVRVSIAITLFDDLNVLIIAARTFFSPSFLFRDNVRTSRSPAPSWQGLKASAGQLLPHHLLFIVATCKFDFQPISTSVTSTFATFTTRSLVN